jgi:epsilon-lactone hydrolase
MPGVELSWEQIEVTQNAANKEAGPRFVPGRRIPVPRTVSPSLQTTIAAPYRIPAWDANAGDAAHWKTLISTLAEEAAAATREMQEKLGVIMEPTIIDGVKAFMLTPKVIAPENRNRLLVNVHGGGYIYNPGVAGTMEATSMAAYGGFKIISVDYRMPPDHPYPAGLDDCMRVWRATAEINDPKTLGLFGSSAGAGMALAMILRAKEENLPLPAAIAIGTPWADLTETGDTFKTNEWLDNIIVSYRGYLNRAARLLCRRQ